MVTTKNEPNNWIIRIQDGKHFFANADNGVWAIRSGVSRYNNILRLFKKVITYGLCKTKHLQELQDY